MKALIIGGDRHGEWIDGLFDGTRIWVDLEHACRHVIRQLTVTPADLNTGKVTEAWVLNLAVHESMQGPAEPGIVSQLFQMLAMNAYARTYGEPQEVPQEPAGSSLVVPGGQP